MTTKPKLIESEVDGIEILPAYHPLQNKLKPMDFFCTQGAGFLGWGIRMITKNMSPDRECEYNHAGLFANGSINTLEALWRVETTNFAEHYEGCEVLIGRYKKMTVEKAALAFNKIERHIGQTYPKRRIFYHLLNVAHHIHWINEVVCSELVAKALFAAGARDHKWWGVTPDNLADAIEHELNDERDGPKYEIIFKNKMPWLLYKYCRHCKQLHLIPIGMRACFNCKNKYASTLDVPDKTLKEKGDKYNEQKIKFIHKKVTS